MKKQPSAAVRVWFFHQHGCPHCQMAMPDVDRFQRRHPRVPVLKTTRDGIAGFEPAGTPAYLIMVDEKVAFHHVGRLTLKELEKAHNEAVEEYSTREDLGGENADEEEEAVEEDDLKERQARDEEE